MATTVTLANGVALQAAPQFKGLSGTLIYLVRTEGFKSLYGGIGPGN